MKVLTESRSQYEGCYPNVWDDVKTNVTQERGPKEKEVTTLRSLL